MLGMLAINPGATVQSGKYAVIRGFPTGTSILN